MKNAEDMDTITDQQYGGHKNKMAQSAVLNKLMYYGIVYQQLMQVAFMDDDARNCYDRIIQRLVQFKKYFILSGDSTGIHERDSAAH